MSRTCLLLKMAESLFLVKNQILIIPSSTNHAVDAVKMNDDIKKLSGMGRYCIARFLKLK